MDDLINCSCLEGYYSPTTSFSSPSDYKCLKCLPECKTCDNEG